MTTAIVFSAKMTRVHVRRALLGTTVAKATIKTWIRAASRPNFNKLIPSRLLCQMFLALNSKGLYQSLGKEKQSCGRVFPSSTKRENSHFHVVSCNDGKEM